MKPVFVARVAALVAIAGFAFACSDRSDFAGPPATESVPSINVLNDFVVTCSANVMARTVKCGESNNGVSRDLIYGGQHTFVNLISSNVLVLADTIMFDVNIENLLGQAIGTTDSSGTSDPSGVRVFFVQGPTSTGAGTITVANPDGISVFTGSNQAYFRYTGTTFPGEFTGAKTWKLRFSQPMNFTFQVGVSAPVEFFHGYIDGTARVLTVNLGESYRLPAKVRNALGTQQHGQTVTWTSSSPAVALVVDSTVTGGIRGYSVLTGVSNTRPTASDVYVHTCQYSSLSNGTVYPDSVTNSDCFTAFHQREDFLPGTTYHGDLYRVSVTAGQTIDISVDTGNSLDTVLALMDRLGFVVASNDDDAGTLGPGSRLQFTASKSDTYVIQVSAFEPGETGTYTISIAITDPI
ncbi:MAG TPA: PPC domain-containing protein [Gemmatimonadaceae bacterium]|nr:PPC domain-containing protein [Gemmatimonadaceae bacterium]